MRSDESCLPVLASYQPRLSKQARTESQVLGNERGTVHQANSELALKEKCPLPCPSNVIRLEVTNQGGITMSQFVYLYRGAERGRSPEKMQEMMQKWMAWMKQLS